MDRINKNLRYSTGVFIIIIAIISIIFHFPIHITDALTLEMVKKFGLKISIWRILFEPVLGVLLFFNRSLYALTEQQYLLVWIITIFIFYSIFIIITIKDRQTKRKFIITQLVNLPIVIGLWFTGFVIMLFIPLPNNTIVNKTTDSILVTTHSHTKYSHDGLISQEGLWKWHKRNGFDAFFITDHNNHDRTLDLVKAQRNNKFPIEPLVICGEEFSGSNHLSLLGLKRKFDTSGYEDSTVIDSVRANGGAVIVNHWFDGEKMSLDYFREIGVDGFEIENTATDKTYNRDVYQKIKNYCGDNGLIMNGGLDFHGYGNVCTVWNAFKIPDWRDLDPKSKEEAILHIIRTRDQSKLKVLLYIDRPYYDNKYLLLSPLFTVFSYFRTLNLYQLISWTFWAFVFALVKTDISRKVELKNQLSAERLIPVIGIISALFLLSLGIYYYSEIEDIAGFSEVYAEYSTLLFYVGLIFLFYSGLVSYFKILRRKTT